MKLAIIVNGSECFKCEQCATVLGESWCKLKEDQPCEWVYLGHEYICPKKQDKRVLIKLLQKFKGV